MANKETLEEAYLNQLIDEANKEFTLDRKLAKDVATKYAKWQAERMYSEEEVLDMLPKFAAYTLINADERSRLPLDKWFEQFKKK